MTESSAQVSHSSFRRWGRRLLLVLLITLALILGLFGALYAAITPVLNHALPPMLDTLVGPGSVVRLGQIKRGSLHLEHLTLIPAEGTVVIIDDTTLEYRWSDLIRGQAQHLHIGHLQTLFSEAEQDPASPTQHRTSTTSAPELSQRIDLPMLADVLSLPVQSLQIDRFELHHEQVSLDLHGSGDDQVWMVQGNAILDGIPGVVSVLAQLNHEVEGHSSMPPGQALTLMLSQNEHLLAQLWAEWQQSSDTTHLRLRLESDLQQLQAQVPALRDLPLNGEHLMVSLTADSPNQAQWPQQLSLDGRGELRLGAIDISPDLRLNATAANLELRHTAGADWQAQLSYQELTGTLRVDGSPWHFNNAASHINAHCDNDISKCTLTGETTSTLEGISRSQLALTPNIELWPQRLMALSLTDQAEPDQTEPDQTEPDQTKQNQTALAVSLPLRLDYDQSSQPASAASSELPDLHSDVSGTLNLQLMSHGDWLARSDDGFQLLSRVGDYQGWQAAQYRATLLRDLRLQGNVHNPDEIQASALTLTLAPITVRQSDPMATLRVGASSVTCPSGIWKLDALHATLARGCDVSLRLNDSDWDIWPIPDVSVQAHVALDAQPSQDANESLQLEQLRAQVSIQIANGEIPIRGQVQHHLLTQKGQAQWHLADADLDWMALGLMKMESLTSLQLLNGQLSGQGWIDWQLTDEQWQVTPDLMLRADNVGAIYDNSLTFDGWHAMLALRQQQGEYLIDAQVSGDSLDSGIALTNLLARTQTRVPGDLSHFVLQVHEIHTDLLGGRVYAPGITYDSRKEVNAFGIRLDHLQLSQIAAIEESAGIKATGLLDGMLPIVLTADGPMVPGGNLFARDPGGTVKYQDASAEALASADQSVGMAMQLLQNFHYDQLRTGVRYQPDGQLNLALQFEGNNPDFFDGQATHLNVNLDYNLLDLLESLRVANDVIENVESKYR